MLQGPGPQVFQMHSFHPGMVFWPPENSASTRDLMTPPPFTYLTVPDEIIDDIDEFGCGYQTWERLEEAGVEKLYWRQPLKHIELGFWSEDVYSAMKELLEDQLSYLRSFVFSHLWTGDRRYYQHRIRPWPEKRRDDAGRLQDYVVPELCSPALPADARVANNLRTALREAGVRQGLQVSPKKPLGDSIEDGARIELAIPSWLNRGSGSSFLSLIHI